MKENKNTMMAVIASTALTAVATARVNECTTLTTNETAIKAVTEFARLDVFDTRYNIKKCEILSIVRKSLQDEKSLTFKKMCEVFEIDNSNAGKMANIWDMFYSYDNMFLEYSVNQLAPFSSKRRDDVVKVFKEAEIKPTLSVQTLREIAKCIDSKNGIIDNGKILDILNGDITTTEKPKTKTKTKTETETETETKTETETETKTETKLIELKDGDTVIINGYVYHICAADNNMPFFVSDDKKAK